MNQLETLLVAGGTGFLGRIVSRHFRSLGWRVIVLSRHEDAHSHDEDQLRWDGMNAGPWVEAVNEADVLLNLAGRSVNCRYNAKNRREIELSRTASTKTLAEAIAGARRPPRVWLNSSTATIYRHAEDRAQGDDDGEIGSGFSVNVAQAWEEAFFETPTPSTRKLALRTAMVMGPGSGGPFNVFYTLARFGLGGAMGNGRQRVTWLHDHDFCRAIEFLIEHNDLAGTVNLTAPDWPTNREFMATLRKVVGQPIGLPATKWMIELGAIFLRTESELPLKSRWVAPTRLQAAGFTHRFADWSTAAQDLVARTRQRG